MESFSVIFCKALVFIFQLIFLGFDSKFQCEENYVHMRTLCIGKLYKIKEIKERYTKCAHSAQAAKHVSLKYLNAYDASSVIAIKVVPHKVIFEID